MDYALSVQIPVRAGAIIFAIYFVVIVGGALVGRVLNKPGSKPLDSLVGHSFVLAILLAIPTGLVTFVGIVAVGTLVNMGIPPIAYLFLSAAGLVIFDAAVRAPGSGMEGCSKMIGLFASSYLVVCGGIAFWMTGGSVGWRAELAGLRFLQPVIAALPFATAVTFLTRNDRVRLFLGFLGFLAAAFALAFFPVENGFAAAWLPGSDWLRFPLAGAGCGALLGLLHLFLLLMTKPRKTWGRESRRLGGGVIAYVLVGAVAGLVWAAARTLVAAL